jgi:hypothetical protein
MLNKITGQKPCSKVVLDFLKHKELICKALSGAERRRQVERSGG